MVAARALGGSAVRKLVLESLDAEDFGRLVDGNDATTISNKELAGAFAVVRGWLEEHQPEAIVGFLYKLLNQALVIRLDVGNAKDAFKLFETINNRGLKLSPTDLIKNFVLGNAARFDEACLDATRKAWSKLIAELDGADSDAFFRYYLTSLTARRITKAEVVFQFKTQFMQRISEAANLPDRHLYADETPELPPDSGHIAEPTKPSRVARVTLTEFLSGLLRSAGAYGEIVRAWTGDPRIDRRLRNLRMIKAAQAFCYLMHLRVGGATQANFLAVLELTESFLLRRHICRERGNETEALFARLCGVDPLDPVEPTRAAYRAACPSDARFREEFATTHFSPNLIDRARYCLERIELARYDAPPEIEILGPDSVHVEHVIPQKIRSRKKTSNSDDWSVYLGDRVELNHPKYVSRIGNLTLVAGPLNTIASDGPFEAKKKLYRKSIIRITKELSTFRDFKFKQVEERSKSLARAAVQIWPAP
jgi:hypothetical protein